ncbi:hypothetical protein [Micromonospora chersina]|uniref:hypothetical protein n=1 Tax=Micromonospora chersina TaxID=47854 RepID=UPI003F4CDEA9
MDVTIANRPAATSSNRRSLSTIAFEQLYQRMSRVERVQRSRRGAPEMQHGEQQHQCLERAGPRHLLEQLARHLKEHENEDQVEEEFQECRPCLLRSPKQYAPLYLSSSIARFCPS